MRRRADPDRIMVDDHELAVLVHLDAQEARADDHGGGQEEVAPRPIAALDGRQGQDHRDRRADQDERVRGRQVDGQRVDVDRRRGRAMVQSSSFSSSASAPAERAGCSRASAFSAGQPGDRGVRHGMEDRLDRLAAWGRPAVRRTSSTACSFDPTDRIAGPSGDRAGAACSRA